MSNRTFDITSSIQREEDECQAGASVFDDPVAYLARFGIAAELTGETSLSAAA